VLLPQELDDRELFHLLSDFYLTASNISTSAQKTETDLFDFV
jgi:hypothetical protein